jgi:cobaltochelatase CobS
MDRFMLCEASYPKPELEEKLLEKSVPELPPDLRARMIEFANDVRRLFLDSCDAYESRPDKLLDVTFSTRSLLRWASLTVLYQPISRQGVSPILYSLDRALGFRASPESRIFLKELSQRFFNTGSTGKENQS